MRPEHLTDAALIDGYQRIRALVFEVNVDLVESLGADKYVYFSTAGPAVNSAQLDELEAEGEAARKPFRGKSSRRFARVGRPVDRVGIRHHEARRVRRRVRREPDAARRRTMREHT